MLSFKVGFRNCIYHFWNRLLNSLNDLAIALQRKTENNYYSKNLYFDSFFFAIYMSSFLYFMVFSIRQYLEVSGRKELFLEAAKAGLSKPMSEGSAIALTGLVGA